MLSPRVKDAPSPLLVATDVDGTISDITAVPAEAHVRGDALSALSVLVACRGVYAAVISGRTMESLRSLTAALGPVYRVAEHGAFIESPDGRSLGAPLDVTPDTIDHLARLLDEPLASFPGMRVERKASGVAVHVREVSPASRQAALASLVPFEKAAREAGLSLVNGRLVVEARSSSSSKERALETVLGELPRSTFVLYAGDDTTDEGAIAFARRRGGIGIYVASAERPTPPSGADVVLAGPAAWAEMLSTLAATRASLTGPTRP
jgi:trehalose 6-phosphate phosphatase